MRCSALTGLDDLKHASDPEGNRGACWIYMQSWITWRLLDGILVNGD